MLDMHILWTRDQHVVTKTSMLEEVSSVRACYLLCYVDIVLSVRQRSLA